MPSALDLRALALPSAPDWRAVHDGVMGGLSQGQVSDRPGGRLGFSGAVSLDNSGGFVSFRARCALPDLTDQHGLRLVLRGDGRTWSVTLRDGQADGHVSWRAPLQTRPGVWSDVLLPFEAFEPARRGRLADTRSPLDLGSLREPGLLLADGDAGPFELELADLQSWRASAGALATQAAASARLRRLLTGGPSADSLRASWQWHERLLVLGVPGERDQRAREQRGRLLAEQPALAERALRVLTLHGDDVGRLAGAALEPAQVRGLRAAWDLPADTWALALVGKDGGVKARWHEPVDVAEILALVDAMPMERAERLGRGED